MTRQLPDEMLRHFIQAVVWNSTPGYHTEVLVIDKDYAIRARLINSNDFSRRRIQHIRERALKDPEILAIVAIGFPVSDDPGTEVVVDYLPDREFYGLNLPPAPMPAWRNFDRDYNLASAVCGYREEFDTTFEMVTDPADFNLEEWEETTEFWKY